MNIYKAREIIGDKIIGVTCHNSLRLAKNALKAKCDYLAFGAFNPSKTKNVKFKASISFLKKLERSQKLLLFVSGELILKIIKNFY